ncbi:MAG: glycosyltransferase family 2 protein, partial [Candidatus Hodarchaeota archaeon]
MKLSYVIITPAKNEEQFLPDLIMSVISQSLLPKKWIIVSDGSVDRTDEIVLDFSKKYNWIELLKMPSHEERRFDSKVNCIKEGYKHLSKMQFDLIATMDADITFDEHHFQYLVNKFEENPKLGVAGVPFLEGDFNSFYDTSKNINHVSGACQIFRNACYEEIGGHIPIKGGGEDWVAVTTARMKGWETRTYPERFLLHHRKMGTSNKDILKARFDQGFRDYYLGNHPLWQFIRFLFQITKKPFILGGIYLYWGF